jgi:hypothetical protein
MKYIITSITLDGPGRLRLGRGTLHLDGGVVRIESAPPAYLALDPSAPPRFTPHPSGGWVCPSYDEILESHEAGDPADVTHVVCRCQGAAGPADADSLSLCGHTLVCQRRQKVATPPAASPLPIPPAPPPPPAPVVRSGELDPTRLAGLVALVEGSSAEEMSLESAVRSVNPPGMVDLSSVAGQLYTEYGLSPCVNCKTWGRNGPSRKCC